MLNYLKAVSPSHQNQGICLHCKSIDWFLHDEKITLLKSRLF